MGLQQPEVEAIAWPQPCPVPATCHVGIRLTNVESVPVSFVGCPAAYVEAIVGHLAARGLRLEATGDPQVSVVWWGADSAQKVGPEAIGDETLVVAVLTELSVESYAAALVAGASAVVHVDASSDMTVDVIKATVHGEVVLPRRVAQTLAGAMHSILPSSDLSDADQDLLRAISQGQTVAEIAGDRFFSERTVRRHLQGVYLKLGVQNRPEAIAAATRLGLND